MCFVARGNSSPSGAAVLTSRHTSRNVVTYWSGVARIMNHTHPNLPAMTAMVVSRTGEWTIVVVSVGVVSTSHGTRWVEWWFVLGNKTLWFDALRQICKASTSKPSSARVVPVVSLT